MPIRFDHLFLKLHDQLYRIERIGAQVVREPGLEGYLRSLHTQLLDNNLRYFVFNFRHNVWMLVCNELFGGKDRKPFLGRLVFGFKCGQKPLRVAKGGDRKRVVGRIGRGVANGERRLDSPQNRLEKRLGVVFVGKVAYFYENFNPTNP